MVCLAASLEALRLASSMSENRVERTSTVTQTVSRTGLASFVSLQSLGEVSLVRYLHLLGGTFAGTLPVQVRSLTLSTIRGTI
jgi:hypothetical protein